MVCITHPEYKGTIKPKDRCGVCFDMWIAFLRRRFYEEVDESIHILKGLKKTEDTSGCYNPYNKSFPRIASVAHTVRKVLKRTIEDQNTGHEILVKLK